MLQLSDTQVNDPTQGTAAAAPRVLRLQPESLLRAGSRPAEPAIDPEQLRRALNVAVAAAMVLGEALRQTGGFPRQEP